MKTLNIKSLVFKSTLLCAAVVAVSLSSCKKDDDKKTETIPVPTPQAATLDVHFHATVNDAHFELNHDYTQEIGGETITYSFSRAAFYVSGITLEKMDGGTTTFADKYLLVTPDEHEYSIGELEATHYTGITFDIGVDTTANHDDPAQYDAGHPLAIQNPSMHWNWNPGYIFMALEGNYSATSGQSGTFTFHLGLDEYLRNVSLDFHHHLEVTAGKKSTVHMEVDYAALLKDVDLRTENFTKSMSPDHKALAEKLANNIPAAFHME
jgi:hypothetical protein